MQNHIQIFSTLTFRKFWNFLVLIHSYWLSVLFKKAIHKGNPAFLTIEPTNHCNLKCPECPSGMNILTRPKGNIDVSLFEKIISETYKELIYLNLYFQGEPFLNEDVYGMIITARKKNIFTEVSTNGHFLDDENCKKIIDSGLNSLIISLDGLDKATYENYRSGGDFTKVVEGIKNLVSWKSKLKSKTPYIKLQFLALKQNEHHIEKLKAESKKLKVDELIIKTAQIYDFENAQNILPVNQKYSRYTIDTNGKPVLKKKPANRCFKMWTSGVITWDGNLVACCFDKDANYNFGNLKETSLLDAWNSDNYNAFRNRILQSRKDIDICRNCSE
jgi:radical SAM protein with 4Fe4S-binding SPASM domain